MDASAAFGSLPNGSIPPTAAVAATTTPVTSSNRVDAFELSYEAMSLDRSGEILSRETKIALRKLYGYCVTCPGVPAKLFDIRRAKLNPLWSTKQPRSVEGESLNGQCLQCYPELCPNYRRNIRSMSPSMQQMMMLRTTSPGPTTLIPAASQQSEASSASDQSFPKDHTTNTNSEARSTRPLSSAGHHNNNHHHHHHILQHHSNSAFTTVSQPGDGGGGGGIQLAAPVPVRASPVVRTSNHQHRPIKTPPPTPPTRTLSSSSASGHPPRGGGLAGGHTTLMMLTTSTMASVSSLASSSASSISFPSPPPVLLLSSVPQRTPPTRAVSSSSSSSSIASIPRSTAYNNNSNNNNNDCYGTTTTTTSLSCLGGGSHHWRQQPHNMIAPANRSRGGGGGTGPPRAPQRTYSNHNQHDLHKQTAAVPTTVISTTSEGVSHHNNNKTKSRKSPSVTLAAHCLGDDNAQHQQVGGADVDHGSISPCHHMNPKQVEGDLLALIMGLQQSSQEEEDDGAEDNNALVEVVLNYMLSYPGLERVQSIGLNFITQFIRSSTSDHKNNNSSNYQQHALVLGLDQDAFRCVLTAMQNFPSHLAIQIQACAILSYWAVECGTTARVALIGSGVCQGLGRAITRYFGDPMVVETAITALRALSYEATGREILQRLHLMDKIVEAMQCNPRIVPVQRDGCALLSNLVVDCDNRTVAQVDITVLQVHVQALRTHLHHTAVLDSACFGLKNLIYQPTNLQQLSRLDGIWELLEQVMIHCTPECSDDHVVTIMEQIQIAQVMDVSLQEQQQHHRGDAQRRHGGGPPPSFSVQSG